MTRDRAAAPRAPAAPLLRAKMRPPSVGRNHVRRARLIELLDEAVTQPLTIVVAPAGAGKTSLLAGWAAESAMPTAWLALDEADRDGVQLWSDVVTALGTLASGLDPAPARVRRAAALSDAVGQLVGDLEQQARPPTALVIDDLHLVDDDESIAASLAFFVQHQPEWLRLVLVSRRTPKLQLDRLRARGALAEVRFDELRFSPSEATELLRRLAPSLPADSVDLATARADGWAASLQLAALAARSAKALPTPGAPPFDDGVLVHSYILNEVLAAESPEMVDALLLLSVARRVDLSLARALTGRTDAGELLAEAEGRGLFVTRLAADVFDLHSLVQAVLVHELGRRSPDRLVGQHLRAAAWYQDNGDVGLALEHLVLAGRTRDALRLLAARHADLYDSGREATVRRVIAAIPKAVATADVEAMLEYAWCHLLVDRRRFLEAVDQTAWWAARSLVDGTLGARLTMLRSAAAIVDGRWVESGALAGQARDELGEGWWRDPLGRFCWNMVTRDIALSERWDDGSDEIREAELALSRDPERRLAFEGTRALGHALAGRPLEALRVAAGVRRTAAVPNMTILRAELATAEALAHRELGDHAQAVVELEALAGAPAETMLYCRVLAGLELARALLDVGDVAGARLTFGEMEQLVDAERFGADGRVWLARTGTIVSLAAGAIGPAQMWAEQVHDSFWGPLGVARIRLAEADRAGALVVLDSAVPRSGRHEVVLGLLRARAHDDHEEAIKSVASAVEQASEHGMLQTVASECPELDGLIEQAAWRVPPAWIDRLRRAASTARNAAAGGRDPLAELTDRERDVLRFLPSRLTLGEIAGELYVSVNTLKFHLKIIYRKLGVNSRAEAAEVARRMTIVSRRP